MLLLLMRLGFDMMRWSLSDLGPGLRETEKGIAQFRVLRDILGERTILFVLFSP